MDFNMVAEWEVAFAENEAAEFDRIFAALQSDFSRIDFELRAMGWGPAVQNSWCNGSAFKWTLDGKNSRVPAGFLYGFWREVTLEFNEAGNVQNWNLYNMMSVRDSRTAERRGEVLHAVSCWGVFPNSDPRTINRPRASDLPTPTIEAFLDYMRQCVR